MYHGGHVYIMTNVHNTTLYTGVTSELLNRVHQHKTNAFPKSFTAKYNCKKLVYYKGFNTIEEAIATETNMKNWKREWKVKVIEEMNPEWRDLSEELESLG
jgi:putative endonuclease